MTAGELFRELLHELLEAIGRRPARGVLLAGRNGGRVREPALHEEREALGKELEIAMPALDGTTEAIEAPQEKQTVGQLEVLRERCFDDGALREILRRAILDQAAARVG